jgi:hypothetical protein
MDSLAPSLAPVLALCALSSIGQGQHLPLLSAPPLDTRPVERVPTRLQSPVWAPDSVSNDVVADGREDIENFPDLAPGTYRAQEKPKPRQVPVIPEPMLFDLMRPLGAERGELEVNTLVRPSVGRNATGVAWAPEVEWAFAPGHTVEFEVPFQGGHLEAFKFGLQGTFGTFRQQRSIHGWQALLERARSGKDMQLDVLHLAGHRFGQHWSLFTMQGVRFGRQEARRNVRGVFNPTVFREVSGHLVFGLETNLAVGARRRADWTVLPQAQFQWRQYSFQMGLGAERNLPNRGVRPAVALRLVRTIGSSGH